MYIHKISALVALSAVALAAPSPPSTSVAISRTRDHLDVPSKDLPARRKPLHGRDNCLSTGDVCTYNHECCTYFCSRSPNGRHCKEQ
ncbi:hypothetical protein McanMca71_003194 [Microsporum canis]